MKINGLKYTYGKQLFKMKGTMLDIDDDIMYSLQIEEKPVKQFTVTMDYALDKLKKAN